MPDPRLNFFICGAPRCGTTALYEYLNRHPQVFLPRIKEPHFFCSDYRVWGQITSWREYCRLFRGVRDAHRAVGEASTRYLYSQAAVPRILAKWPDARLIVMFREPVGLFQSMHLRYLHDSFECEPDPEKTWQLQGERRAGRKIPRLCVDSRWLQYGDECRLGSQVQRLLRHAPREQVYFIRFERFREQTELVYNEVLGFLGLPLNAVPVAPPPRGRGIGFQIADFRFQIDAQATRPPSTVHHPPGSGPAGRTYSPSTNHPFARINATRAHRFRSIAWCIEAAARSLRALPAGKRIHRTLVATRVPRLIRRLNRSRAEAPPLRAEFRQYLAEYFRDDVELLEELLGWDLSHWKSPFRAAA